MTHLSKEGQEEYRKILNSIYKDRRVVLFEVDDKRKETDNTKKEDII